MNAGEITAIVLASGVFVFFLIVFILMPKKVFFMALFTISTYQHEIS